MASTNITFEIHLWTLLKILAAQVLFVISLGFLLICAYHCCTLIFVFLLVASCCEALGHPYVERCYMNTFYLLKKKKKLKLTIVPGENTKTDCTKNAKSQHTKSYHVAAAMHDVNECVICAEHCFYQPEMLAMSSKFCNLFSVKITTL